MRKVIVISWNHICTKYTHKFQLGNRRKTNVNYFSVGKQKIPDVSEETELFCFLLLLFFIFLFFVFFSKRTAGTVVNKKKYNNKNAGVTLIYSRKNEHPVKSFTFKNGG